MNWWKDVFKSPTHTLESMAIEPAEIKPMKGHNYLPYLCDHDKIYQSPPVHIDWPDSVPQTARKHLWLLRKCGVQILNWVPRNAEAWRRWKAYKGELRLRLHQALMATQTVHYDNVAYWIDTPISPSAAAKDAVRHGPFWSAEHQQHLQMLAEQILRLEYFLIKGELYFGQPPHNQ